MLTNFNRSLTSGMRASPYFVSLPVRMFLHSNGYRVFEEEDILANFKEKTYYRKEIPITSERWNRKLKGGMSEKEIYKSHSNYTNDDGFRILRIRLAYFFLSALTFVCPVIWVWMPLALFYHFNCGRYIRSISLVKSPLENSETYNHVKINSVAKDGMKTYSDTYSIRALKSEMDR
jgi:hypothetical protein